MYIVTITNDGENLIIHHPQVNDLKVTAGQIKTGINTAANFSFTILPNNPGYKLIRPLKTLISVRNIKTDKIEFDGRILMPTENMSDSGAFAKSYTCESELSYLNDSCQRHGEYHDITVRQFLEKIIENHNNDVDGDSIDKKFVVGNVDVTDSNDSLYRYLSYDSTYSTIQDKLISSLGGEISVRKENGIRYLDYLKTPGEVKTTEIKLAKNLKSIQKETDPSEIITKLLPLGATIDSEDATATDASQARITIASVNDGEDCIYDEAAKQEFTIQTKTMTWDDITVPANLKTAAEAYIKENNRVKIKYTVTALDLSLIKLDTDSFEVGNYYPVINSIMGIDEILRVVEKTINIINPNQNSLGIGDKFKTTSQYQYENNKAQANVVELKNTVSRQTNRIGTISNELQSTKGELETAKQTLQQTQQRLENFEQITDGDIAAISQSVSDLLTAIDDIQAVVDGIPIYEIASTTTDGLMSKEDKTKLDDLQNYDIATTTANGLMSAADKSKLDLVTILESIDLGAMKEKLDLITILNPVDLDDLVARVAAIEGGGQ